MSTGIPCGHNFVIVFRPSRFGILVETSEAQHYFTMPHNLGQLFLKTECFEMLASNGQAFKCALKLRVAI